MKYFCQQRHCFFQLGRIQPCIVYDEGMRKIWVREGGVIREESQAYAQLFRLLPKCAVAPVGFQAEEEVKSGTLLGNGDTVCKGTGLKRFQHGGAAGAILFL